MGFKPRCELGENTQACTDELKFCIQVTGYGQDQENQKMYFYQEELTTPVQEKADEVVTQVAIPSTMHTMGITGDCPSTLFNWDKNKVTQLKLGLKIKTTKEDSYIYLPVTDHLTTNTKKDQDEQYKSNHFLAFIPLAVQDQERSYANYLTRAYNQPNESNREFYMNIPVNSSDVVYAPAREGYLYIFFNKKLWRELKIEQDETGKNTYQDIDVSAYRTDKGIFLTEENLSGQPKAALIRKPTGVALDNIWLPFRLADKKTNIQITFCEDQLSPERLNLIEAKLTGKLTTLNTAENFRLIQTIVKAKNFNKTTQPFRIDYLPTTRGRNLDEEWKMFYPATYLTDITDQAIAKKYQSTKTVDQLCTNKQAPDRNTVLSDFNNIKKGAFREFEISAWQEILAAQTNPEGTPQETFWSKHEVTPSQDMLADYRARYILGIPVVDPLNEIHRHHMLLSIAQNPELFKCLAARTKQADKNEVGHFVANAAYIDLQLRNTIKGLPKQVRHNYNRSIANAERSYLLNCIELWQDNLTELLTDETTEMALINILSNHLIPEKYAINLQLIANCLQRISKAPVAYDPMLTTLSAEATKGQVFIYKLANTPEHSLHKALWPKVSFEELTEEAPTQYQYKPNKGDGVFSEHTIIAAGEINKLDEDLITSVKAELFNIQIQTQNDSNLELLRNELKAGYSGLYGLFCVLVSAVDETNKKRRELLQAVKVSEQKQTDHDKAQTKAEQSAEKAKRAEQAHKDSVSKQEQLTARQLELEERIVFDKNRLAKLGLNEKALLDIAPTTFKGETFLPFIKQLRMVPVFKDIRYILPNKVYKDMFALGVYNKGNLDILEKIFVEFYGTRGKGQATLWGKFAELTSRAKIELYNIAVDLKDWVLGMKVSQIKGRRQLLAAFAKHLEVTLQHLLEEVNTVKLKAANAEVILHNKKMMDLFKNMAKHDSKVAATAKAELEQALQTIGEKQQQLNNVANYKPTAEKYQKVLKSPMLPGALMMIEAWNIFSVYEDLNNIKIKRGEDRAQIGKISALFDGGLAILLFTERLELQSFQFLTKTFEHITWVRNIGLGQTNLLGVVNCAAMALTAGICFWDAIYYYDRNNPAWIGYAMAGTGASMLALQALLPALITPMGWFVIGVGLLLVGLGLASYLDNSDKLKEWFLQGPYRDNDNETYAHLQDSTKALYHLISLLLYFDVKIVKIDKLATQAKLLQLSTMHLVETPEQEADRERQLAHYKRLLQADLKVSVQCFCANFLTGCLFLPALARYNHIMNMNDGRITNSLVLKEIYPIEQLAQNIIFNETGVDLYLKTNSVKNWGLISENNLWVFKLQMIAIPLDKKAGENYRVFPAPPLEYQDDYDVNKDSKARFKEANYYSYKQKILIEQNFWFETAFEES